MTAIVLSIVIFVLASYMYSIYSEAQENKNAYLAVQKTFDNIKQLNENKAVSSRIKDIGSNSISATPSIMLASNLIVSKESLGAKNISDLNKYHEAIKQALKDTPNISDDSLSCSFLSSNYDIAESECNNVLSLQYEFIKFNNDNSVNLVIEKNSKVNNHLVNYFSTTNSLMPNSIIRTENSGKYDYKIDVNIPLDKKSNKFKEKILKENYNEFKKALVKKYFYNATISLAKTIRQKEYISATYMLELLVEAINLEKLENPTKITIELESKILNMIAKSITLNMNEISIGNFKRNSVISTYINNNKGLISLNVNEFNLRWE